MPIEPYQQTHYLPSLWVLILHVPLEMIRSRETLATLLRIYTIPNGTILFVSTWSLLRVL